MVRPLVLREGFLVPTGFLALAVLLAYPLVLDIGSSLPGDLHDPLLNAWILAWDADRIRHGLQGLWDAPNFYPYDRTLIYSENLLGIAVFTAPVQWLTGNPLLAYNVAFLASYMLSGWGMYLLTGHLFRNRYAAAVAGVTFAFLPYRVSQISHLQVLVCGWMPFALYGLHRYFGERSYRALLGFAATVVLQVLSNLYYAYFLTLPVAIVSAFEIARAKERRLRTTAELALTALVILVVLSPVAIAYYQGHSEGLVRPRGEIVNYSANVASYLHVNPRLVTWGQVLPHGHPEAQLFPGGILVGLAAIGVATGVRRRRRSATGGVWATSWPVRTYLVVAFFGILLSLGPEPRAWGHSLGSAGLYDWLLTLVPGLDGIRVPARLAMVTYLALSVLAAAGVTTVLSRFSRRTSASLSLVLCSIVAIEGLASPFRVAAFPGYPDADRRMAYDWLRRSPPGAVLELPVSNPAHNYLYQFATLEHGHRVVNGHSGYTSALFEFLRGPASPLSEPQRFGDLLEGLRALGVRYVVTNTGFFEHRGVAQATVEAIQRHSDQLVAKTTFGGTHIFWLTPWEEPGSGPTSSLRRIPATAFAASASRETERLAQAFDGNPATRWLTAAPQHGGESIVIRFAKPRNLGRLMLLQAPRSLGDYPRGLVIEGAPSGDSYEELYRGGVVRQLLDGIVRDGYPAPIVIDLPDNWTSTLRIRQTGTTRTWYWSVDELSLWER